MRRHHGDRHAGLSGREGRDEGDLDRRETRRRSKGDELFARLRRFYDDDALVELTAIIAWENASSKFNRALRIPSQGLWKRA